MAHKKGSDDLYRLVSFPFGRGKRVLQEICPAAYFGRKPIPAIIRFHQPAEKFDEIFSEKEIQGYADMKVYLFDLLLDSLSVYHNKPDNIHVYLNNIYTRAVVAGKKRF